MFETNENHCPTEKEEESNTKGDKVEGFKANYYEAYESYYHEY